MRFRAISIPASLSASLLLAGCAGTEKPQLAATEWRCPPLAEYAASDARAMGRELRALSKDSPLARYVVDARNLRRQCGHK